MEAEEEFSETEKLNHKSTETPSPIQEEEPRYIEPQDTDDKEI